MLGRLLQIVWVCLFVCLFFGEEKHSGFEWLCKQNRLRPEPIRFVKLDSEHAQGDGMSVNRGLLELELARGRDLRR